MVISTSGAKERSRHRRTILLSGVAAFLLGDAAALAQGESQADDRRVIDEIIVTARFRSESVQDIGASVGAVSGADIASRGLSDLEDFTRTLPGIDNIKSQPNSNEVTVRGISNAASGFASSALFSIFYDNVPVTTPFSQRDFNAFDLNRVELLRGPQPTLFGEGSVGGTLRYFSADPDLDGPRATGVAHGRFESITDGGVAYRVENATSFNIVPGKLGVRLMGFYREDDGFIDQTIGDVEDANTFENFGGRAVVLARPTDDLEIRFSVFISRDDVGENNQITPGSDPDDLTFVGAGIPGLSTEAVISASEDDVELYALRLTHDFGPITVTSISGLYQRDISSATFSAGNSFGLAPFFPTVDTTTFSIASAVQDNLTQEFRFVSNFDGPFNFTSGFFYQNNDFSVVSALETPGFEPVTLPPSIDIFSAVTANETEEFSGFIELTYEVTDRLRLIGGFRYIDEQLTTTLIENTTVLFDPSLAPFTEDNPIPIQDTLPTIAAVGLENIFTFDLERFLPRGGIEFDLGDNILLYANAAVGARQGGVNEPLSVITIASIAATDPATGALDPAVFDAVFSDAITFDSDDVLSIDWGAKTSWLDGALTVNLGLFYSLYEDAQIQTQVPFASGVNGPDQRIFGLEFESVYLVNNFISTFLNFSLIEAEFTEDFSTVTLPADVQAAGIQFDILDGDPVINSPTLTLSAGIDFNYPLPFADFEAVGNATFQYIGERFSQSQSFPSARLGSLENLGFRLGLQNGWLSVVGFVTNALNDIELQSSGGNVLATFVNDAGELDALSIQDFVNRPRTFGVDVTIRY